MPRHPRLASLAALSVLVSPGACASGRAASIIGPNSTRVLFIGNSLTYTNDLPGMVRDIAASVGDSVRVATVAAPNLALIDHVEGMSEAMATLRGSRWDVVVVQQGPTSRPIDRDTLVLAVRRLTPDARRGGARVAQLMAWPSQDRLTAFDSVRTTCDAVAAATGARCLAAGSAWHAVLASAPSVVLYGPDGFHPAVAGTYLAALVVYEDVTGHDARLLPGAVMVNGRALPLAEPVVRLLQQAAHSVAAARVVPPS